MAQNFRRNSQLDQRETRKHQKKRKASNRAILQYEGPKKKRKLNRKETPVTKKRLTKKRSRQTKIFFLEPVRPSKLKLKEKENVDSVLTIDKSKKNEVLEQCEFPFKCSSDESLFKEFEEEKELGKGSYGVVVQATRKGVKGVWAIKKTRYRKHKNPYNSKGKYMEVPPDAYRELEVSAARGQQIKPKHIIPLHEVIFGPQECWFIYPAYSMDLSSYISQFEKDGKKMPHQKIKTIFHHCVLAVQHLHQAGFIHRDIKPSNYLIQFDEQCPGKVLLADFGLSVQMTKPFVPLKSDRTVITLWYRPLDLLLGNRNYDYKVDVWSLACILGELIILRPFFQGKHLNHRPQKRSSDKKKIKHKTKHVFEEDQVEKILQRCGYPSPEFLQFAQGFPDYRSFVRTDWLVLKSRVAERLKKYKPRPDAVNLLNSMLKYVPSKRPNAATVLKHEFFQKVDTFFENDENAA